MLPPLLGTTPSTFVENYKYRYDPDIGKRRVVLRSFWNFCYFLCGVLDLGQATDHAAIKGHLGPYDLAKTGDMTPRIIVTHPARQGNIYIRPWAAEQAGLDVRFLTGLYYRPDRFPYSVVRWLPRKIRQKLQASLEKRRILGLSPEKVTSLMGPWLEVILRPFGLIRQWDSAHDWIASLWVSRQKDPRIPIVH